MRHIQNILLRASRVTRRCAAVAAGAGAALLLATPASAVDVRSQPDESATFNGTVRAIAYAGNTVYIGGDFTAAYAGAGSYRRSYLAALNATTGALLSWNPAADGKVRGLAVSGSTVYAVGDFAYVDGLRRHHVVALDATTGSPRPGFTQKVEGLVNAVGIGNDRLYLAGAVTSAGGSPRAGAAALSLTTGAVDPSWTPALAEGSAESLAVTSGRIYLGGTFRSINGVSGSGKLAAVSPTTGAVDRGFNPPTAVVAYGVAVSGSTVYAALGGQGGRAVAYGSTGATQWTVTADGDVQALGVAGDQLILGGHFDKVCRSDRTGDHGTCLDGHDVRIKMAAVDLSGRLRSWAPNGNGVSGVYTVGVGTTVDKVAVGGAFTTIGGLTQRRFAQFDVD